MKGQATQAELLAQAKPAGQLAQVMLPAVVVTRPTAHWSQLCIKALRKVPAGHGSAASTRFVSSGGTAATPVTVLSTGSEELRSIVLSAPAKAAVAFRAERKDAACVALTVATENATVAEACMRCRPANRALVMPVMVIEEAGAARVDARDAVTVVFCAAPKLVADTPVSVMFDAKVVCVELAKPGGFTVHATAPGAGEYDPAEHGWHSAEVALRKVPAAQGVHPVRAALL